MLLPKSRPPRWTWPLSRVYRGDGFFNALSLAAGLAIWEILGRSLDLIYLPPFSNVLRRLVELTADGRILSDLARSLQNLGLGFGIAAVMGILVGTLMGRYTIIERMLDPYVYGFMTSPTIVFAPIYFSIFGLQRWAIVALIIQYAVFIVVVNTVTAVKSVDRELLEMAAVFGSNERQRIRKIVLPGALPLIMAGLRLAMGRAVKGMINGELLIAVVGLGATSQSFARAFDAEGVFAVLMVVVVVALVAVKIVEIVDKRLNGWLPNAQR
ncbi:MAG: ABC transporter permease [Acidimicrobiales bacterium]